MSLISRTAFLSLCALFASAEDLPHLELPPICYRTHHESMKREEDGQEISRDSYQILLTQFSQLRLKEFRTNNQSTTLDGTSYRVSFGFQLESFFQGDVDLLIVKVHIIPKEKDAVVPLGNGTIVLHNLKGKKDFEKNFAFGPNGNISADVGIVAEFYLLEVHKVWNPKNGFYSRTLDSVRMTVRLDMKKVTILS